MCVCLSVCVCVYFCVCLWVWVCVCVRLVCPQSLVYVPRPKSKDRLLITTLPLISCSLLSNLARDLRQEFYPFYPRILSVLAELFDPRHPAQLEQVFGCLGYLFKFLQKQMLADLETAFR
jgi:DMSO/TMAO reductase YedYZ heme-binding membrane subunit